MQCIHQLWAIMSLIYRKVQVLSSNTYTGRCSTDDAGIALLKYIIGFIISGDERKYVQAFPFLSVGTYPFSMITGMVWSQMDKILIHIASLYLMNFMGYILYLTLFVPCIVFIFVGQ